ncbi:hypothetical protein [Streptomyces griseorubiginosus]|uniref:hypothetical protein n=1 Tax=Streptomyces griseorubiginosus TaxID=67304 RepID=UPI0036E5EAEA
MTDTVIQFIGATACILAYGVQLPAALARLLLACVPVIAALRSLRAEWCNEGEPHAREEGSLTPTIPSSERPHTAVRTDHRAAAASRAVH